MRPSASFSILALLFSCVSVSAAWPAPPSCNAPFEVLLDNTGFSESNVTAFTYNRWDSLFLSWPRTFATGEPVRMQSEVIVYVLTAFQPGPLTSASLGLLQCSYYDNEGCRSPMAEPYYSYTLGGDTLRFEYVKYAHYQLLHYGGVALELMVRDTGSPDAVAIFRRSGAPRNLPLSQVLRSDRADADYVALICVHNSSEPLPSNSAISTPAGTVTATVTSPVAPGTESPFHGMEGDSNTSAAAHTAFTITWLCLSMATVVTMIMGR
jgi:hypothetical protein